MLQARREYDNNDLAAARERSLTLVNNPVVPRTVRIVSWWLLSLCTENLDLAEDRLDEAIELCEEMEAREDSDAVRNYRRTTEEMRAQLAPSDDDEEGMEDDGHEDDKAGGEDEAARYEGKEDDGNEKEASERQLPQSSVIREGGGDVDSDKSATDPDYEMKSE